MKILLLGEYSGLHNSLKRGLQQLGHDVLLVGTGDGYKRFDVDLDYGSNLMDKTYSRIFVKIIHRISGWNLVAWDRGRKFKKLLPQLKGFDVVQLINEHAIKSHPKTEIQLLKALIAQNGNFFLLSCGTDYISVHYALQGHFKYSILTPWQENKKVKANFDQVLKYVSPPFKALHEFIYKNIKGVIASDLDYHLPLKDQEKYLGMIPNPVDVDQLKFKPPQPGETIKILHGFSTANYIKKGNRFFDEALDRIAETYPNQVEIKRISGLPYSEYLEHLDSCHILLDQVYAYDQGYNALTAMAMGKVVFSGAETEWLEHYGLDQDQVAINALPDVAYLTQKLSALIDNPAKIAEIGSEARSFIEDRHHYKLIAEAYCNTWLQHSEN